MNAAAGDGALWLRCAIAAQLAPISRAIDSKPPPSVTSPLNCRISRSNPQLATATAASAALLRQPLALAAQQRPETEAIIERAQSRKIRSPRPQIRGAHAERHVADDPRQAPRQENGLAMLGQALAERAAAAQPQVGDAADIGVKLIERAEFAHQRGRDLRPDARHAGNVVRSVAG